MADAAAEKEEFVQTEIKKEAINDFFQSEILSDITIVNQATGANYKAHKLVLASCSQYFLELFLREDVSKLTKFDAPKPVKVSGDIADDTLSKVLKYFYHNQNFAVIKDDINEANAAFILSQAFVLKAESLKKNIEHQIIDKILNADNCTQYYLDSLKFDAINIQKQCEKIMVTNFAEIS